MGMAENSNLNTHSALTEKWAQSTLPVMRNASWLISSLSLGALLLGGCGDNSSNPIECGANTTEVDGECIGDKTRDCAAGTVENADGNCVPDGTVICETGTTFNSTTGSCDADITGCQSGTIVVNGECRDPADVQADVEEAPEPNGLGGTPGVLSTPAVGAAITVAGCIEPTFVEDETIADYDSYVFAATGPTLLDITVDGYGGAAGAFQLESLDQELRDADFLRFGVNLANDMSKRQVFLPKAGDYVITFGDSRSFFLAPAGGPGACYLASIANVAIPAATPLTFEMETVGSFSGDAQFFSLTPTQDAILFGTTEAPSSSALVDTVLMVNDVYRGSSPDLTERDFGESASTAAGGLNAADSVVYVVDPVINFALVPVDFVHLVGGPVVVTLPADGSTASVPHPDVTSSVLSFSVASDGDVKFLDLDASSLGGGDPDMDWFIYDSNLALVTPIDTFDQDGLHTGYFQFESAGTYYIGVEDFADTVTDPYSLTATQVDYTPTPVVVGTPLTTQSFGASGAAFYTAVPASFEWWSISGTPTGFDGDYRLDVFGQEAGQLNENVPSIANFVLSAGVFIRQVLHDAEPVLLMVTDSGANTAATFDLSIANEDFTDLGVVTYAAPISAVITGAASEALYSASATPGNGIGLTITGQNGFDPILVIIDDSGETIIDDVVGADSIEVFAGVFLDPEFTFAVRDANGVGGDYTIDIVVPLALSLSSAPAPALAIPDDDPAGVDDIITNADACTVASVQVPVNVSHTWSGDLVLALTSPDGTTVVLRNRSGGGSDDIVGTYPTTLTPVDDLDTLVGEDAVGDWTLNAVDASADDTGTLNSWGLTIGCQ